MKPAGAEGVEALGHRKYVGGRWDQIGKLTFDFLIKQRLESSDVLVDIGCGAFRVGRLLIPYLDRGNYLGLEAEPALIKAGLKHEVPQSVVKAKRPEIVISSDFEFERFSKAPDIALAQSLFTHLNKNDIERCLRKLHAYRLYATFHEVEHAVEDNPKQSHPHARFRYCRGELVALAAWTGWRTEYLGQWGHPRGQAMMTFIRG